MAKVIEYNKLVRDRVPERLHSQGIATGTRTLDGAEFLKALNAKLDEEHGEYKESGEIEELVDVVEVIKAILDFYGVTWGEFERLMAVKISTKGAFKNRVYLTETVEQEAQHDRD